jgi:2-iminobutanoate/2-iminopropanoate deaminase
VCRVYLREACFFCSDAPAAVGPYSQAIVVDNLAFVSGCIALDPKTGQVVEGGIEAQVKRALQNLGSAVEASGSCLGKVVKTTVCVINSHG